mmetsp:Transcript_36682/g.91941  ORF Transcript_36682/g.91941 Transcript_36682/m.91941 type:complete len:370 (-) Transcript_36682:1627-2736(-)
MRPLSSRPARFAARTPQPSQTSAESSANLKTMSCTSYTPPVSLLAGCIVLHAEWRSAMIMRPYAVAVCTKSRASSRIWLFRPAGRCSGASGRMADRSLLIFWRRSFHSPNGLISASRSSTWEEAELSALPGMAMSGWDGMGGGRYTGVAPTHTMSMLVQMGGRLLLPSLSFPRGRDLERECCWRASSREQLPSGPSSASPALMVDWFSGRMGRRPRGDRLGLLVCDCMRLGLLVCDCTRRGVRLGSRDSGACACSFSNKSSWLTVVFKLRSLRWSARRGDATPNSASLVILRMGSVVMYDLARAERCARIWRAAEGRRAVFPGPIGGVVLRARLGEFGMLWLSLDRPSTSCMPSSGRSWSDLLRCRSSR